MQGVGDERAAAAAHAKARNAAAVLTFVLLLVATELVCRAFASSGFLYRRLDVSGALTSVPEIEDRLRSRGPGAVVLLGDSILGGTALWEHRVEHPRARALGAALAKELAASGRGTVGLAADGLLLPDLEPLARKAADARAGSVLLLLNFRMFAAEFQTPERAISRDFLVPPRAGGGEKAQEASLSRTLFDGAARDLATFRTAQLLRTLWYFPTQKDALQRLVEPFFGPEETDDVREAALRLKIAPYYKDAWSPASPAFHALLRISLEMKRRGVPLAVALAPQNPEVVEGVGDRATFEKNRALLAASLARTSRPLLDLSAKYPAESFLDHCHLTADGNHALAADLAHAALEARP
jgi:hypothetical protein